MTSHSETRVVPYAPRQMYDLVADVGEYPEFIPWITGARVRGRKPMPTPEGAEVMEADLVIGFKMFRERYTSRVEMIPAHDGEPARIDVEAISGPFTNLITHYVFREAEGGCAMDFSVTFGFRNKLMQSVAGAAFDIAMRRVAGAFEERAKVLYG